MARTSTLIDQAIEFATRVHAGQRQDADASPFISHPLEAAGLLRHRGYPEEVLAAAILHDVVENTDVSLHELRERFGPRVAELVATLTEDRSIDDYEQRKAELRRRVVDAGPEAAAIFAADKVAKLRDLRAGLREDGPAFCARQGDALDRKLRHYEETLRALREAPYDVPLLDELEHELTSFRRELAQMRGQSGPT
jgi:(p)ppGpp synthase/HD superfamily hydrolase